MIIAAAPQSVFYRGGIGLDGVGYSIASVRSANACVTVSVGGSLGVFVCVGKSSVVSETSYDSVLWV